MPSSSHGIPSRSLTALSFVPNAMAVSCEDDLGLRMESQRTVVGTVARETVYAQKICLRDSSPNRSTWTPEGAMRSSGKFEKCLHQHKKVSQGEWEGRSACALGWGPHLWPTAPVIAILLAYQKCPFSAPGLTNFLLLVAERANPLLTRVAQQRLRGRYCPHPGRFP